MGRGDLIIFGKFEWDAKKARENIIKHNLSFPDSVSAFLDPKRIIAVDELHSKDEERFFCIGKVNDRVATVRFTMRNNNIRVIGAGFWRKGKTLYEKEKNKKS